MDYKRGIDVSEWQGEINWDKLAASGEVDFVMIRAGLGQGQALSLIHISRATP